MNNEFHVKLPAYFIQGVLLSEGRYVDMNGNPVEIDFKNKNLDVFDIIPIYAEHGGKQIGYATRLYMSDGKIRFDGFVFDKVLYDYLQTHPGVSAELTVSDDKLTVTAIALTKFPAIPDAQIDTVVALSDRAQAVLDYLKKHLTRQPSEQLLQEIATIVAKFIAENEYPSPEVKCSMNEMEAKIRELEEINAKLSKEVEMLQQELAEKEEFIKTMELKHEVETLLSRIREYDPEFNADFLMSKPLEEQKVFLEAYYELAKQKGKKAACSSPEVKKVEFSAPDETTAEEMKLRKIFGLE